jgi:hypothetical protein
LLELADIKGYELRQAKGGIQIVSSITYPRGTSLHAHAKASWFGQPRIEMAEKVRTSRSPSASQQFQRQPAGLEGGRNLIDEASLQEYV